MVSPDILQAAVISFLKATAVITAVTNDIREANFQGIDISYPNVRVDLSSILPSENGECRPIKSRAFWTVSVYDEQDSSYTSQHLAGIVAHAMMAKYLHGDHFRSLQIDSKGITPAARTAPRIWRTDVHFVAALYETVNP